MMKAILLGALCVVAAATKAVSADPIDAEAIAAGNMSAVVLIHGKRSDTGAKVQGSGCCVHPDGYILATAHQAEGVSGFTARFADGTEVPLNLVASQPEIEFALFKMEAPAPAVADLGDAETVKSGAPVVSIASPINLEFSTVSGTVSNPNKLYDGYPVMLVSLTATHGSSGGPVFDRAGRLIGLISGGLTDVNFTIVNKINNAYALLGTQNILPGTAPSAGQDEAILIPAAGISTAELRAIEAYNRGVSAATPDDKIESYGLAVTLLPQFYEALFNLAVAQAGTGDVEEAARTYLAADKLRPDSTETKRNLGRIYLQAKQFNDAIAVFEEVRRLAPTVPQSHNDLGEAYRRAGKLEDAAEHFRASLALDNNAPGAHFNLAITLANAGQPEEAIRHFEAYLALAPAAGDREAVQNWINKLKTPQ